MTMFLLPPSETKLDATGKTKFTLKALSFSELSSIRSELISNLSDFSFNSPSKARTALGLSAKQDFERLRNTVLKTAPVSPAWKIYSGVLYDAINAEALSSAAINKLSTNVYVQSALFGLISLGDQIPSYRLSADTKLPKIGSISNLWASPCREIFLNSKQLIVDLRSGQYVNLAPIPKEVSTDVVTLKIFQRMPAGPPKVVSHHNKATKGRIIREIVTQSKVPTSIDQLVKTITRLGAEVELVPNKKIKNFNTLNVIVDVI
jgi:cytoplasmic iron level regulating protein YaaA (DUF328/UPF0246 family)